MRLDRGLLLFFLTTVESCLVCSGQTASRPAWDLSNRKTVQFLMEKMESATAKSEFSSSQPATRSAMGSFFSTAILAVFLEGSPCKLSIRETTFTRQSANAPNRSRKDEDTTIETVSHLNLTKAAPSRVTVREFHPHADAQASAQRHSFQTTQQGSGVFEVIVSSAQPDAFRFVNRINGTLQPETTGAIASFQAFSSAESARQASDALARLASACAL